MSLALANVPEAPGGVKAESCGAAFELIDGVLSP